MILKFPIYALKIKKYSQINRFNFSMVSKLLVNQKKQKVKRAKAFNELMSYNIYTREALK
ncbi:hypothetical protein acsn021_00110 [Anaerocolumna cellulosilytica]|uniref:Uncharacterized protein n=1 Tax=Anaerocolumna cellulosilytica TaxID=433286 RepID=A0A6S6QYU0_9FIRM|nr:hypothetical protein acsn021_00110 [Anaerocolumna cellulosilytica]